MGASGQSIVGALPKNFASLLLLEQNVNIIFVRWKSLKRESDNRETNRWETDF